MPESKKTTERFRLPGSTEWGEVIHATNASEYAAYGRTRCGLRYRKIVYPHMGAPLCRLCYPRGTTSE